MALLRGGGKTNSPTDRSAGEFSGRDEIRTRGTVTRTAV